MRTILQCTIAAAAIAIAKLYSLVVPTDLISISFIILCILYALVMYSTTIPFAELDLTTQNKIQRIMERAQCNFTKQFIFITLFYIISLLDNIFALGMLAVSAFSVLYYYVNTYKLIELHKDVEDKL